jgi:hypothetical protein
MPQSIALHIGAHKTASSHLQNELYRNREMLAEEGIRVYGPGYLRMKGRNLAAMFGLSWSESPEPRRDAHEQLRFLAKGRKRLVFTEENFVGNLTDNKGRLPLPIYPSGPERVGELVAKWAPVQTQLFVAIRNPAAFMASAYSQALFGGTNVGPRTFRAHNDWRQIDWAEYVAKLRATTGLGEIYVWRQEDYEQAHRLILRRLLRWKVGGKVDLVEGRLNEGLSADAVRQTLQWVQDGKTGSLARDARAAFPVGDHHKPFALYAASTLAAAQAVYDEQFARIGAIDGVTVLHPPTKVAKPHA